MTIVSTADDGGPPWPPGGCLHMGTEAAAALAPSLSDTPACPRLCLCLSLARLPRLSYTLTDPGCLVDGRDPCKPAHVGQPYPPVCPLHTTALRAREPRERGAGRVHGRLGELPHGDAAPAGQDWHPGRQDVLRLRPVRCVPLSLTHEWFCFCPFSCHQTCAPLSMLLARHLFAPLPRCCVERASKRAMQQPVCSKSLTFHHYGP